MAWIVKGFWEGLDRFTSEGEELKLCSHLHKKLDSTLSALEKITETLGTAPGTSETLNDIDKTLHWLEEYCDTFLEKDTFQDKSQRQMCYDTIEHLIIQIEHIMKLFNTADLFRCVLREAEVCYGNLKECEVAMKKLSSSLEKYPGTAESQAQKARESPQQRRPVLGTAPGGFPGLRTLPGLPALRAPPGRLPVLVTPEDQFPVCMTPENQFPVCMTPQERFPVHGSRSHGLPASESQVASTSYTQRVHPNESERS